MTITRKQANKMRGKLSALLDATMDFANASEMSQSEEQYANETYCRLKREFLDEIKNITETSK